MAVEIERKFLVASECWRQSADSGRRLRQGYLASSPANSVRIRVIDDTRAWLAVKSGYRGISRYEFEYEVPLADALVMLELRQHAIIDKVRFLVPFGGLVWEVDVFNGANEGLVIAEVELDNEARQPEMPPWVGEEVSGDLRYQNSQLAAHPFSIWAPIRQADRVRRPKAM